MKRKYSALLAGSQVEMLNKALINHEVRNLISIKWAKDELKTYLLFKVTIRLVCNVPDLFISFFEDKCLNIWGELFGITTKELGKLKKTESYHVPCIVLNDLYDDFLQNLQVVYISINDLHKKDQKKPKGAIASKIKDGKVQIVIYDREVDQHLLMMAIHRAKKLDKVKHLYPEGQWGYHLHTKKHPIG